ncbi:hypothetical protein ACJJTC_017464 [Scirpophaga incertulas]
MFVAGGFAVTVFNKKNEIVSYTQKNISKINFQAFVAKYYFIFKLAANFTFVVAKKNFHLAKDQMQKIFVYFQTVRRGLKTNILEKHKNLNIILLRKLKVFAEERKKLGHLLIAAVRENKNIRTQYQLEALTKNRLVKRVEQAHHQIKENHLQYASFQHLYLITHQENILLKARISKLKLEKENAEKNLINIISKVYQTKNTDLITYCSNFIVKPKEIFLQTDVAAEVQKFLAKSNETIATRQNIVDENCLEDNDVQADATAVLLASDTPKLIGLPGERLWTIKDRNGIIKKLYDCEFKTDLESGDSIRRIREYSVYFDKDCLLDYQSSRVVVSEINNIPKNTRFLTGSQQFKNFLECCVVVPYSGPKR